MTKLTLIIKRFKHIIRLFEAYIYYVCNNRLEGIHVFHMSENEIFGPN